MTQSRKEQVKNLKTKYIHYVDGPVALANGGYINQITGLDYNSLLSALQVTDSPTIDHPVLDIGGAETDAPALITGSYDISSTLAFGNQFSITMPNVNGGVPFPVTLLLADQVILNGVPVITIASLANRINITAASFGVPVPIASNVSGLLTIKSADLSGYTYGDNASITFTDITPGVVSVMLGSTYTSGVPVTGTTAPKRGIITRSQDGLGGYIQLKNTDGSSVRPYPASYPSLDPPSHNIQMVHQAARQYGPSVVPGRPIYARFRESSNPTGLLISYYHDSITRPTIITNNSNFSALTTGDSLYLTVRYGSGPTNYTGLTVDFSAFSIVTIQDVIDAINQTYSNITQFVHGGVDSTKASIQINLPGPVSFIPSIDKFKLTFDGGSPKHITFLDDAPLSASQLADRINVCTGSTGNVYGFNNSLIIESSTSGWSSSLLFEIENSSSTPNSIFNILGISPGLYTSGMIAFNYGSDEIQITCPSIDPNASITFGTSSIATAQKLGLDPASASPNPQITINASIGANLVAVDPPVQALIPEMLMFSEVPDDNDVGVNIFNSDGQSSTPIDPKQGIANLGLLGGLLGTNGKIDPNLISSLFSFLGVDRTALGANLLSDLDSQLSPRISTPQDSNVGPVLVWQGPTLLGNQSDIVRFYFDSGNVYITVNALMTSVIGSLPQWLQERQAVSTLYEYYQGKFSVATQPQNSLNYTWSHTDWVRSVKFNPTGSSDSLYGNEVLKIGESNANGGLNANDAARLIPRIEIPNATFPATPSRLLLIESTSPGATAIYNVRIYINLHNTTGGNGIEITTNASWDGTKWNKDVNGVFSSYFLLGLGVQYLVRSSALNAPWSVWDSTPFYMSTTTFVTAFSNTINLGTDYSSSYPYLALASTPRLEGDRSDVTTHHRTLLFQSTAPFGSNSPPLRMYLDSGDISGGNCFTFTTNALWNNSTNMWNQDDGASASGALVFGADSQTKLRLLHKASGSVPWDETTPLSATGWDTYDEFTLGMFFSGVQISTGASFAGNVTSSLAHGQFNANDGLFRVTNASFSNISATSSPLSNALYAKSMIKSWGRGAWSPGSGSIIDGFNFANAGITGGSDYAVTYVSAMSGLQPAVLMTIDINTASNPNLTISVDGSYSSYFDFAVYQPDAATVYSGPFEASYITLGVK